MDGMPIAQAIRELRSQLAAAMADDAPLRFRVDKLEVEFELALGTDFGSDGKLGWGIFSLGGSAKRSDERTHRLTMALTLIDPRTGQPVLVHGQQGDRPGTGASGE